MEATTKIASCGSAPGVFYKPAMESLDHGSMIYWPIPIHDTILLDNMKNMWHVHKFTILPCKVSSNHRVVNSTQACKLKTNMFQDVQLLESLSIPVPGLSEDTWTWMPRKTELEMITHPKKASNLGRNRCVFHGKELGAKPCSKNLRF